VEIEFEGRKIKIFNNMADYVNGNPLMCTSFITSANIGTPFVDAIQPYCHDKFMYFNNDRIEYNGKQYIRVEFGESEDVPVYLRQYVLNDLVFKIFFTGEEPNEYVTDSLVFRTREEASEYMYKHGYIRPQIEKSGKYVLSIQTQEFKSTDDILNYLESIKQSIKNGKITNESDLWRIHRKIN
jgi:hypothetical protein